MTVTCTERLASALASVVSRPVSTPFVVFVDMAQRLTLALSAGGVVIVDKLDYDELIKSRREALYGLGRLRECREALDGLGLDYDELIKSRREALYGLGRLRECREALDGLGLSDERIPFAIEEPITDFAPVYYAGPFTVSK